ncbi:MAG: hypothetical protein HKM93_03210 [Desulfobacteraceae bacterium]|nr:hypothetical protein [Desulfobacteraceae bacterium]
MSIPKKSVILSICAIFFFIGCGPETIFLRPGLDTPSHHVSNGNKLLDMGKIEDAFQEFSRAKELDPEYTLAYVGMAMVYGHRGEYQLGRQYLAIAESLAGSDEEAAAVHTGLEKMNDMEKKTTN